MLPYDIVSYIMYLYYKLYVLSQVANIDTNQWMWKCSKRRRDICTERGSIQIGHTYNDAWSVVYLPYRLQCDVCNEHMLCENCVIQYSDYK